MSRVVVGVGILSLGLAACATQAPHRPDAQEIRQLVDREEAALVARVPAYGDARLHEYLAGVVGRLLRDSGGGVSGVRIAVLADPTLAAFAMPTGHIYVHTGLLSRLESEVQLAAILARELARSAEVPALEPTRGHVGPVALSPTAAAILGLDLEVARASAIDGYGEGRESEADAEAVRRLAAAGYDPAEAIGVFRLLAADGEERGPLEVFTYGDPRKLGERERSMRALLETGGGAMGKSARGVEPGEFTQAVRPVVRDNAVLDLRFGRYALARRALDRVLALDGDDAMTNVFYGDLYRLQSQRAADGARDEYLRKALERYRRALELDPDYPETFRQLGLLHYQTREIAEARAAFATYLTLKPDAADARRIREYLDALPR